MKQYIVDAFTDKLFSGNQAAVCVLEEWISDYLMQNIARENNFSETAFGCTLGIIPHITACILGLSAIMHMSARIFAMVKYAGAAYLMYLAWKTWTSAGRLELKENILKPTAYKTALRGVFLNLLNPKLTLFFFSFLPQFIPSDATSKVDYMLVLSLVFMLMTLIVFIIYGLLAGSLRELIQRRKSIMRNIERGFALSFAGLSLKIALEDK